MPSPPRVARSAGVLVWLSAAVLAAGPAAGADLARCQEQYLTGQYEACLKTASAALEQAAWDEQWWILKLRSLLATGRYQQARKVLDSALQRRYSSVRLRLLGHEVCRRSGDPQRATALLEEIQELASRSPWRYSSPANRVALGRAALLLGADPRQVLELFFDRAKQTDPDLPEVYLAVGQLGLAKHDGAVAAEAFEQGAKRFPEHPDMHYGLARAYAAADPKRASAALASALRINPRHVPSLLFQADQLIDSERYEQAAEVLAQALAVNPWCAPAWSYRAVLAHLRGDMRAKRQARAKALHFWKTDPEVDYLIGKKLSQKYRFAEGAEHQRRALAADPNYLPAKLQLAQDLLRLGQEQEGWKLAGEVFQRDAYDVVSYNLMTLHDHLAEFATLRAGHFIVRMDRREAELYGDRVLELLGEAEAALGGKYGLTLETTITVEIFPDQSDFAVRTFGMPGGTGYLGVCFGKVITANSPATRPESPTNWQSVLWHEFCHVVTLELTGNKMPRWLSEGISVYEERQRDWRWGQRMNARYRRLVLDGKLVPISELSAAFLAPGSAEQLQFAYYEASLVVEFLIERYGFGALRGLLRSLAADEGLNESLQRHTGQGIAELERQFAAFAWSRAVELAPGADLEPLAPELARQADARRLAQWLQGHPDSFWGNLALGAALVRERQWRQAQGPLRRAIDLYGDYVGTDNPYLLLAAAYRKTGDSGLERSVLEELVQRDADSVPALLRLLELDEAAGDWPAAAAHAQQLLAVQPLLRQGHWCLAQAAEATGEATTAVAAYRRVLLLEPPDPAEVHYRLARLLYQQGQPGARRHVLMALEQAPRYGDALRLLLRIHGESAPAETDRPPPGRSHTAPTSSSNKEPEP